MQTLEDIRSRPDGWQAVHFHLSDLLEEYKSEYQVRIAVNLMHDLLKNYEGGIFLLIDQSIIVVCQKLEKTMRRTSWCSSCAISIWTIRWPIPIPARKTLDFCTVYDLKRDWQEFFDLCSRRMAFVARKQPPGCGSANRRRSHRKAEVSSRRENRRAEKAGSKTGEPSLSLRVALATIERDLDHVDLQSAIRRQPVCAVLPNMTMRRVFDELYIHIAHLRQMLQAEVDFFSNRWLFKYLTQILDERMIALLRHNPARYLGSPVSINLNVETLLSPRFAEFDAVIKPHEPKSPSLSKCRWWMYSPIWRRLWRRAKKCRNSDTACASTG